MNTLTGKEKSFVDSDLAQLFPRDSCTDDEVLSSDSHSVTTFPERVNVECEYDDTPVVGSVQGEYISFYTKGTF